MARATFLQNIMTGEVQEFASFDEAYDAAIVRNKGDEHWSIFPYRPAPFSPKSTEPFVVESVEGTGIGTFERQAICEREIGWQMADLDATLARIEGADDITRFLHAAE